MFEPLKNKKPLKILFACSGNIMRSPIAEMLFEKILTEKHGEIWQERIEVASGGVRFKNSAIHRLTRDLLLSEGIPADRIAQFKPRHIDHHPGIFASADIIITMTERQKNRLIKREPGYTSKTVLLTDFLSIKRPIRDPWLSLLRKKALAGVAETIKEGLNGLLKELEKNEFLS